jgi:hypothetical protein
MRFGTPGPSTSSAEVTRISESALWLQVDGDELHLPFELFPWFRGARPSEIKNVERPSPHRLRWPDLDVDLSVESIRHPEKFPLVSAGNGER